MKEKLLALLMVSVMVVSAVGAISISATKVNATTLTFVSLTYTPEGLLKPNQYFTLTGKLSSGSHRWADRQITLWSKLPSEGDSSYRLMRTVYTDANGQFSYTTKSTQSIDVEARYAGEVFQGNELAPSSKHIRVFVGPWLTLSSTNYYPAVKQPFTLSGTLKLDGKPLTNQLIHLERRAGTTGTWEHVANTYKKTDSSGKVSVSQTILNAGTYQYRWHFPGTSKYHSAYSAAVTIKVSKLTAIFSYNPYPAYVNDRVTFNASKSTSQGSAITSYSWDLGDHIISSGKNLKEITYQYPKPGSYTVTLTVKNAAGQTNKTVKKVVIGDKWAIVIGVAKYPWMTNLRYSTNDASRMAELLYRAGFTGAGFTGGHIQYLENASATKAGISTAINKTRAKAGPNDLVVFYFSGHGETSPTGKQGICPYDAFTPDTIIWDYQLASWLNTVTSRNTLCIFDSCFSGGMVQLPASPVGAPRDPQSAQGSFMTNFIASAGLKAPKYVILMASGVSEESKESGALQHGVFTYYLLKEFKDKSVDKNYNKWISAEEAFSLAKVKTTQLLSTAGVSQHPILWDGNANQQLEIYDLTLDEIW